MRINKILAFTALTTVSISTSAFEANRLSGEIMFATGYVSTNSNLSVNTDSKIDALNSKGSHSNDFVVMPLGQIQYDLGKTRNQRIYLGTSRDDLSVGDLAFELGYQYDLANGTQIDFAFIPTLLPSEGWANPYQTGSNREKEDIESHVFRTKLTNLMNSGFSVDMAYASMEIDNERIEYSSLHRDADTYYIKGSYLSMFSAQSGLISAVSYQHHDAEGKAATYNQYQTQLTYFLNDNAHALALTGSYHYRDYSASNPVFNKDRRDNRYKLFLSYEYSDIQGWDNWSVVSFSGVTVNRSNIDFYQHEDYLVTVGMNYKF
ncbi:DUF2860 family protein [Vibrio agarivorans]|uniref:DUF2860 family protein n=1 Tax=Vibrio agarivorans TaxID=153622 RepID=A0ABT7Y4E4_9VIBR|nr:DUF2860 family protein [Vibrio agarivorans]MDN2482905.1 DUF2860 family protein [Vibrio agarivorans]